MISMSMHRVPTTSTHRMKATAATRRMNDYEIRIGILSGHEEHEQDGRIVPMAVVWLANEYGAPNGIHGIASGNPPVPERSFVRTTIAEHQGVYRRLALAAARRMLAKGTPPEFELAFLGGKVVKDIHSMIYQGHPSWPPLADSTVMKKGHDDFLRETYQLIYAIGYEVSTR